MSKRHVNNFNVLYLYSEYKFHLFIAYFRNLNLKVLPILPYFGKRKQVTKVKFLVKEQNVSVIYTDVNGIS